MRKNPCSDISLLWWCQVGLTLSGISVTSCHPRGVLLCIWIVFQECCHPPPPLPGPLVKPSRVSACSFLTLKDGVTPSLKATAYYVTRHHCFTITAHLPRLTHYTPLVLVQTFKNTSSGWVWKYFNADTIVCNFSILPALLYNKCGLKVHTLNF